MAKLNISENNIGELVLPEGWTKGSDGYPDYGKYKHTDGRKQEKAPAGSSPDGAIALADAIKNNGALTSLDISLNNLGAEGAKHVAEAIKVNVSSLQLCWYYFVELELTSVFHLLLLADISTL